MPLLQIGIEFEKLIFSVVCKKCSLSLLNCRKTHQKNASEMTGICLAFLWNLIKNASLRPHLYMPLLVFKLFCIILSAVFLFLQLLCLSASHALFFLHVFIIMLNYSVILFEMINAVCHDKSLTFIRATF